MIMRNILFAAAAAIVATTSPAQPLPPLKPPRLVIVISVDQFGADLFDEYRSHFTSGLARLAGGTVFRNGYQGQAATETCPGHSTIMTGSLPATTGIISNSWIDPSIARAEKMVYCAEDERAPGSTSKHYTVSALHLKVPTLGEILKKYSPASRNVAVAGKDRAAVMMGGHVVDQRWYWTGKAFNTDVAGAPIPRSVPLANAAIANLIAKASPPLDPPPFCKEKATTFPLADGQSVGSGRLARAAGDYSAFRTSPDFDGATLAIAAGLVQDMKLGRGNAPDILSIGLSATDFIGHAYGNGGEEMCLQMFALDREIGDFFRALDSMKLDYAVVLTADHGLEDLTERMNAKGSTTAARADPALSASAVGKAVASSLGLAGPVLLGGIGGDIYLAPGLDADHKRAALAKAVAIYRAHPQIASVFTKAQLEQTPVPTGAPDSWTLIQRARASFDRHRSGDLVVLLKKGVSPVAEPEKGDVATHGSPWDYDRRVPILFWRPGMTGAEREEAVDTVDIMPTVAAMIDVPLASPIDGHCLAGISGIACP